MSAITILARVFGFVIAQPGVSDFLSRQAHRLVSQATVRLVHAINQGSKTRKTVQTMR